MLLAQMYAVFKSFWILVQKQILKSRKIKYYFLYASSFSTNTNQHSITDGTQATHHLKKSKHKTS